MKHSMKWSAAIFAAGLVLCSPAAAEQKEKGATTAPATKTTPAAAAEKEAKPKKDTYPLYGEVVSVNATTLVIKGGVEKPNRTFVLNKDTEIVDGDKAAKVSDVKAGHWVGGLIKKTEKGDDQLLKLNVGVKQKEAKAAEPAATGAKVPDKKKP
ncbi:hypothetical protein [Verrucomicrobium sp. BvORR034]|uniref:hypothetical protein n=1 Tax=Verrucomicrobium sp. BvORR034 TaxID=1396418 RepID=UPI002240EB2B|nr:hypothetical protein [Verrucomicrobium sp. BvORR034]